ncbi:MAG: ArsR family transcriptional regulator, partial [Candidatus Ranarchaeia archaeon]
MTKESLLFYICQAQVGMPLKQPPSIELTKRQYAVLQALYEKGTPSKVIGVEISQEQLAKDLNISRQALSNHLRILRDLEL